MANSDASSRYWRANIKLIVLCLCVWALIPFGLSMFLRPLLASITVGGVDLGFWFAQQGSIISFIALVFFYAWQMNRLDKQFSVDDKSDKETV